MTYYRVRRIVGIAGLILILFWTGSCSTSKHSTATKKDNFAEPGGSLGARPEATMDSIPVSPNGNPLTAAAQEEGALNVIALPHDWCNYGEIIPTFQAKYGIQVNELDPNAGPGDEIEAIKDNKDPQAPDVIDVSFAFGEFAKSEGLLMPYKVAAWDSIADGAKDPEAYWYGGYYGVLSFLVNTALQPDLPRDWVDLLDPKYQGQVALSGDPRISSQAVQSVFAAALANGGSLDDALPGLEFFAKLNRKGNLMPWIATNSLVKIGAIPIRITWDYDALPLVDSFAGNPKATVVIPTSGRLAGAFVQGISAYAPHPNASKLWMEFLYSDEGQMLLMKGYCHPIREADLRRRGVIPTHMLAKIPDTSGIVFPSIAQLEAARTLITTKWDSVVGADIQAAP